MAKEKTFRRNPDVTETDIDEEIFLVEPESEEVFYMDTVSAGLWRLLAEPSCFDEISTVYMAAFPDADNVQVTKDLRVALNELLGRGLVLSD
ncbi:MAG: PqqD family peptide modification chaperone [Alphaproteobacteria bacterium]|nr:PqqD family peptide modification chaperone [Alphaproteobacteria bacterium]